MERLSNRECSTESGVIFLDAISNYERIADHARNICRLNVERGDTVK